MDGWIARLMDGCVDGWYCCYGAVTVVVISAIFHIKKPKKSTKSCITFNGQIELRLQRLADWTAGWPYGFNLSGRCESLSIYRSNYEHIVCKYVLCL